MSGRQDTGGLSEALRLVGAAGGLLDGDGETVELFEAADGGLPLPLPAKGASGARGGRPKGARNRSTEEWVRYFLGAHKSPLTMLGQLYSMDVRELHDLLQAQADKHTRYRDTVHGSEQVRVLVDPAAVLKLQRDAATAILPYIHKQQPKAIEIEDRPRGVLIMGEFDEAGAVADDSALPLAPIEQKQALNGAARAASDTAASDTAENAISPNGLASNGD